MATRKRIAQKRGDRRGQRETDQSCEGSSVVQSMGSGSQRHGASGMSGVTGRWQASGRQTQGASGVQGTTGLWQGAVTQGRQSSGKQGTAQR